MADCEQPDSPFPRDADANIRAPINAVQQMFALNIEIDKSGQLKNCRDVQSTLIAPIRRLPVELLSAIFEQCLLEDMVDRPTPQLPHPSELLTQICREWRAVAISTPRLWCTIIMRLNYIKMESQTALVTAWLLRSAGCPLSIGLTCVDSIKKHGRHPAVDALVQHSCRWQNVYINGQAAFLNAFISAKGHLDGLHKLNLKSTYDFREHLSDTFSIAPQLHRLTLCAGIPSNVELPWEQITQCSLTLIENSVLELLQRLTSLVDCHLHYAAYRQKPMKIVSHLRSLHVTGNMYGLRRLFNKLVLPDVLTITLDLKGDTYFPRTAFLNLIHQSLCTPERLILLHASMAPDDLISCLAELPSLIELEVGVVRHLDNPNQLGCFNDTVLSRLNPRHDNPANEGICLLPRLRVLKLWGPMEFNDHTFADMVQSRWCEPLPHVTRLEYISLKYYREWDEEAIARLAEFRNDGLGLLLRMVPENTHEYVSDVHSNRPSSVW
jgi:hypothetical protein